jgi:hypothetical protein
MSLAMRRTAVSLALVTALAACNRKHADPSQGFHPDDQGQASGGALPPPPNAGPGALAGQGEGDLPPASGEMPDDDVHAGLAARAAGGGGANPHGAGGGADMGSMGFQSPDPNAPVDPNKYLRGSIHPSDATKDKIAASPLIYIAVWQADASGAPTGGMPIATKQVPAATFPLAFDLNEHNIMIQGTPFTGDVVVIARYAHNPDPLMKAPGDIVGQVRAKIPADKLDITLDHVLAADEIKPPAQMPH